GSTGAQRALCIDHYLHEHMCHNERWVGFERLFRKSGRQAQRLRVPGQDIGASAAAVATFLADNPDVDAILTLGPPGAETALAAQDMLPAAQALAHVTFDVARLQLDGIRGGRILATIDSQQYLQGYLGVQAMWLHVAQGFTLASDILTG